MKKMHTQAGAIVLVAVVLAAVPRTAGAQQAPLFSGHGPVFGMTTPTNARDAWAVDFGFMGRQGEGDDGAMFRTMFSRGLTEDVQFSVSIPYVFSSAPFASARLTGMMPGSADFEMIGAWRFHRRGTAVGTRFESTAYAGAILPGVQRPAGMARDLKRRPGMYAAVSTGMASRSHYAWAGAGYTRFGEAEGDRRPSIFSYSAVWGYRPPPLQKEYPHWDWRLFVELTGERASAVRRDGLVMADTRGHSVFLGPATLGIYKNFAIEGGVQFPVYQELGSRLRREQFRYALNVTRFF